MPTEYWILVLCEDELLHDHHMARVRHGLDDEHPEVKRIAWALDVVADCIRMYMDDAKLPRTASVSILSNVASWVRG